MESVAENTVDAVVAPAFWGAVAGAPGALGYRAVNTLDSMVGHRSPRYANYGWASARLDDALAWVPARLTAALVALVRPRAARAVWVAVRRPGPGASVARTRAWPRPRSPPRSASGSAGANRYGERVEERPALGAGRPAGVDDIGAAVAAVARRQRRAGRRASR